MKSKNTMRLSKFLAECGVSSRRKAEEFIKEGKVKINNIVVKDLATNVDAFIDKIKLNEKVLKLPSKGIVLLHKPRAVITTRADVEKEERRTVFDLIPTKFEKYFPVGRLDYESTGLVLLTNDGDLAQVLMHPAFHFIRVYDVKVRGNVQKQDVAKIRKGVKLEDGFVQAKVEIIKMQENTTWLRVEIRIGKNRIIRRLLSRFGYKVEKLKRIQHGPFKLGKLGVGDYEVLTFEQYSKIKEKIFEEVKKKEAQKKAYKEEKLKKLEKKVNRDRVKKENVKGKKTQNNSRNKTQNKKFKSKRK